MLSQHFTFRYFKRFSKPECPEKNTDLSQVTDQLYRIILFRVTFTMSGTTYFQYRLPLWYHL
jgi:hypothetical protein